MRIYFIRHVNTVDNSLDRLQGHSDSPPSEKGLRQLDSFPVYFVDKGITKIIASPLERARLTARRIGEKVGVDPIVEEAVKEMCYGSWDKVAKSELRGSEEWLKRNADKYNFVHPGSFEGHPGESYASVYPRMREFFERVSEEKGVVLVVAHLGVVRNAKRYFEGVSGGEAVRWSPHNNEAYVVDIVGGAVSTSTVKIE